MVDARALQRQVQPRISHTGQRHQPALDHTVGLRVLRQGQSMFDAQFGAELI